jgi:ATP-binding cassette subfamily F protein 3
MLQINGITKSFGPTTVLKNITFHVNPGEKIALVGSNGSGKSTLLNIVSGELEPDSGTVKISSKLLICYVRQGLTNPSDTVEIAACSVVSGGSAAISSVRDLERRLTMDTARQKDFDEYALVLEELESTGAQRLLDRLDASLHSLGMDDVSFDLPVSSLSGGQQSKIVLAGILAAEPDVVLLDEPTNHLDLPALEWLEEFVRNYLGTVFVVSHDRLFLDQTVTRVVELQPDGSIENFVGNYSEFVETKDVMIAAQLSQWRSQEAEARRIRADIARQKQSAENMTNKRKPKDPTYKYWAPENTAKVIARRAKTRESKLAQFESSEDRVEKPTQQWRMKLDLAASKRSGDLLVRIESANAGYGSMPIFESLDLELRFGERIALMGANGSGKSTLFKLFLHQLEPTSGSVRIGFGVTIGYMPQESHVFDEGASPLSYIQSAADISDTEARNFLHYFLFQGDGVFTAISNLSYGERSRLVLAGIVVKQPNLLLLDEPLNHLDIPSRERFEEALKQYTGTVVVATHDRTFVDSFASTIWWIDRKGRASTLRKFLHRRDLEAGGVLV